MRKSVGLSAILSMAGFSAYASDSDLAQQLANPIAAIISVPLQFNYDENIGVDDKGSRTTMNFQPVVPFSLDSGANIITRTIIPYIWQDDVIPGTSQNGFGDISLNAWYSPATKNGLTWGVGPTVLVPTDTDVSGGTWGAGVTGIVLKVQGPWTYGALSSHTWDVESDPETEISRTFLQPFLALTTKNAWTFSVNSESTYDWKESEWSIPINAAVSKLAPVGKVPVQWQAGVGCWAASPDDGPEGWRLRLAATIVIPR